LDYKPAAFPDAKCFSMPKHCCQGQRYSLPPSPTAGNAADSSIKRIGSLSTAKTSYLAIVVIFINPD